MEKRGDGSKKRYPDWDCPECPETDIFGSKSECPACGCFRSKSKSFKQQEPIKRPGDWDCSGCKTSNFASRAVCYKCNAPNLSGAQTSQAKPAYEKRAGDWDCPGCKTSNFASRAACFKCKKEKPAGEAPAKQEFARKDGDWDCSNCKCVNFASRRQCFKCKRYRESKTNEHEDCCVICMERPKRIMFSECKHLCACKECAYACDRTCPICRTKAVPVEVFNV